MTQFATYCPEDNKLRLYVGRVPRPEYDALRAEGWTSTPKQDCDFVAVWTPTRAATARDYSEGEILDEDQSPADRAADRAERFSEYREKRSAEAHGLADLYDRQPDAYGFQSQERADRAARRLDRVAGHACDAWSKAEYWQRRTAGVISHALYTSTPAVRMGRIKEIESDLRKIEKALSDYGKKWDAWKAISEMDTAGSISEKLAQDARAQRLAYHEHGDYIHPRTGRKSYLYDFARVEEGRESDPLTGAELAALWLSRHSEPQTETEWSNHLKLRLAYENQMLEAQGGRAAFVEMEPGGWLGSRQIQKVNKSNATGRVVSVLVRDNQPSAVNHYGNPYPDGKPRTLSHTIKTERLDASAYRPPTDEERARFAQQKKAEKSAAPKPAPRPLINPTDDDAEKLQAALNAHALADHCRRHFKAYGSDYAQDFKPSTVLRIPQKVYSAAAAGSYGRAETRGVCRGAEIEPRASNMYSSHEKAEEKRRGPAVCQVRTTDGDGSTYGARRVIIITDKPQKPLPADVWNLPPVIILPPPAPAQKETELVLWGKHDAHGAAWLKLSEYTLAKSLQWQREGWTVETLKKGEHPNSTTPAPEPVFTAASAPIAQAHFGF